MSEYNAAVEARGCVRWPTFERDELNERWKAYMASVRC
jgi:hypothetical protein